MLWNYRTGSHRWTCVMFIFMPQDTLLLLKVYFKVCLLRTQVLRKLSMNVKCIDWITHVAWKLTIHQIQQEEPKLYVSATSSLRSSFCNYARCQTDMSIFANNHCFFLMITENSVCTVDYFTLDALEVRLFWNWGWIQDSWSRHFRHSCQLTLQHSLKANLQSHPCCAWYALYGSIYTGWQLSSDQIICSSGMKDRYKGLPCLSRDRPTRCWKHH